MARPLRVEFPGAVYHVTARGNERRRTFRDDLDRRQFLATLEQAVQQHALRVHAFCLMPNHYHLLVETPCGNLSRGLGWLQTTYTIRFNRRHRRSGHLFQGRFKAHLVEADSYAMELLRYLHLNPVRPRDKTAPVPREGRRTLREYPWSSHRAYLGKAAAPPWLCTDWLSFFGRKRQEAQKDYARFVDDAFGAVAENPGCGCRVGSLWEMKLSSASGCAGCWKPGVVRRRCAGSVARRVPKRGKGRRRTWRGNKRNGLGRSGCESFWAASDELISHANTVTRMAARSRRPSNACKPPRKPTPYGKLA